MDAAPPPQRFVVQTDRAAVDRIHRGILLLHAALTVMIFVMSLLVITWTSESALTGWSVLPFLILLLGQTFQLTLHAYTWGGRRAIGEPMVITWSGLEMNLPQGRFQVPWQLVAGVEHRRSIGRHLVLRLHPETLTAQGAGVVTDLKPRTWARLVRLGPRLGERGIQQSLDQVVEAIGYFSQGRVPLTGGALTVQ